MEKNCSKRLHFFVRCHQDLTHKIGLKPVDEAYEAFYKTKTYADILQTPYVVLETPNEIQDKQLYERFSVHIKLERSYSLFGNTERPSHKK